MEWIFVGLLVFIAIALKHINDELVSIRSRIYQVTTPPPSRLSELDADAVLDEVEAEMSQEATKAAKTR